MRSVSGGYTMCTLGMSVVGYVQDLLQRLCRAQWLRGRASDSRLREPGFESCAAVLKLGQVFSLYIAPVHSAV